MTSQQLNTVFVYELAPRKRGQTPGPAAKVVTRGPASPRQLDALNACARRGIPFSASAAGFARLGRGDVRLRSVALGGQAATAGRTSRAVRRLGSELERSQRKGRNRHRLFGLAVNAVASHFDPDPDPGEGWIGPWTMPLIKIPAR